MGSENEIPKYELDGVDCLRYCYGGSPKLSEVPESEAEWSDPEDLLVRFSDHVAARKADQERIAAAEKLADEVERVTEFLAPGEFPRKALVDIAAAFRASLSGETD